MKKAILVSVSIVLLCAITIAITLFVTKKSKNDESEQVVQTTGEMLFAANNTKQLDKIIEQESLKSEIGDEYGDYYIYDVDYLNQKAQFVMLLDGDSVEKSMSYILLYYMTETEDNTPKDFTAKELKEKSETTLGLFCENLGVDLKNKYYIIDEKGVLLDNSSVESYEKIKSNKAYLEFKLNNQKKEFWTFKIYTETDNSVVVQIERYTDYDIFADWTPNITIE